jgi:acetyl esterase/lipase
MKFKANEPGLDRRRAFSVILVLLTTTVYSAAEAQLAPAPTPAPAPATVPQRNMLVWPMPDTVSPEGRALSAMMAAAPLPDPWPPLAEQRRITDAMQTMLGAQWEKRSGVHVESAVIAGVPVRIVFPKGMTSIGGGPVVLDLHGGGFSLDSGSLTETIPIAALTGMPVVAVLYRLAPEFPYPAAVDDALAVYESMERGRSPKRIAVIGTSAGAVLGAQLVARLARLGRPMPAALGFLSGSADLSKNGDSESWMPLPNNARTLAASLTDYIGRTAKSDPGLSPIYGDLSVFPPTLLLSSTRDILLSATAIFARALAEHGVDARLVVFDGLPHAFWSYMDIPETDQANALIARFLQAQLAGQRH